MKNTFTLLLLLVGSLTVLGQNQLFSGQPKDSVVRMNTQSQQFDYVPGVLLVKFRDGTHINFKKSRKGLKSSQAFMNRLINKYGIVDGERLFPDEERLKSVQILTAPNGNKFKRPSLNNIYKLKLKSDNPRQLFESISSLKADSAHVVYAEPDYIYSIVSDKANSPVMTEKQAEQWIRMHAQTKHKQAAKSNTLTPNDPLYSQQWGIPATQVNQVWDTTTGDTTQIIGILDTGVDWKHPDLKANIWKNPDPNTAPDANGVVDDVRGWDFVNHDNDPSDDNSHGTHVAGIAAAVGNNGIGIAGVDWHAKIMPVKVFQSDGRGDVATITKGIIYAATHGATVINMSFGSYARSFTMEAALENAYATSVLVAAAGNDDTPIGPPPPPYAKPFFPAALSYVLGIQATQQNMNIFGNYLVGFSNFDQDGPVFSRYPNLWNYEFSAPGAQIISTIPGGNYRVYSGTSMAAPMASGLVALYRQIFPLHSQELMWGNFINTTSSFFPVKLFDALHVKPKPVLNFVSDSIVDTLAGDNKNGIVDAGETIQLWFNVRNTWGQSDSVFVGLKFGEFEDTTTAQILKDTAFIGSISAYATRSNKRDPLSIRISPQVAHDRDIVFEAYLWYAGATDTVKQKIVLTANHGTYLSGVMDSTLTLTPDRLWLVYNSFRVGTNGTLIIKPGTNIEVSGGNFIDIRGHVSAIGTPDSLIHITSAQGESVGAGFYRKTTPAVLDTFEYINFSFMGPPLVGSYNNPSFYVDHCLFQEIIPTNVAYWVLSGIKVLKNSVIRNVKAYYNVLVFLNTGGLSVMVKNNFYNLKFRASFSGYGSLNNSSVKYNNFVDINAVILYMV